MTSQYTYATLVSTSSYIPGVKILYRSLQKNGHPQYPFVCICSKDMAESDIAVLEKEGIVCKKLDKVALDNYHEECNDVGYWYYTFDKLLVWGLTEYDKIVFIDSDMMVLNSLDDLFEKPANSAAIADGIKEGYQLLNSGIMVIEPNKQFMQTLLNAIPHLMTANNGRLKGIGDQDVIHYCLPSWKNNKDLHLSEGYNIFFWSIKQYEDQFNFSVSSKDDKRRIRIIHFAGVPKPWSMNIYRKIRHTLRHVVDGNFSAIKYLLMSYKFQWKK